MADDQKAKADQLFDEIIDDARAAAALDTAAGYAAAINALKWAASILNPAKFGTKVVDEQGNTAGYMLETGIRRVGDPGFIESGAAPHGETKPGSEIHNQNGSIEGQGFTDDVGVIDGFEGTES